MQVRKKLDILDAFRFGIDADPDWFTEMIRVGDAVVTTDDECYIRFMNNDNTIWFEAMRGWVIVKDLCGVVYPVEPAVFGMMFEVVRR